MSYMTIVTIAGIVAVVFWGGVYGLILWGAFSDPPKRTKPPKRE